MSTLIFAPVINRILILAISLVLTAVCAKAQYAKNASGPRENIGQSENRQSAFSIADSSLIKASIVMNQRRIQHHMLAGAKVGALFAFGLEMNYILSSKRANILYLAAAAQSSIIWNTVNIGGGFFIGNTGFGIGCRYNHLLWFELEHSEKNSPGYEPEIVWYKRIGFNKNMYINFHGGAIVTKDRVFPDVTIGFMLPLN